MSAAGGGGLKLELMKRLLRLPFLHSLESRQCAESENNGKQFRQREIVKGKSQRAGRAVEISEELATG